MTLDLSLRAVTSYSRTNMAIGVVRMIGLIQCLSELIIFYFIDTTNVMPLFCTRIFFSDLRYKNLNLLAFTCVFFVLVCFVIIFAYVSTAAVTKSSSCDKTCEKLSCANSTVLLHLKAGTLCCIHFNRSDPRWTYLTLLHIMYFYFLVLMILPRCPSSLIYGLKDSAFSSLFK